MQLWVEDLTSKCKSEVFWAGQTKRSGDAIRNFCLPHGRPGSGQCDGQDLGGGDLFPFALSYHYIDLVKKLLPTYASFNFGICTTYTFLVLMDTFENFLQSLMIIKLN